MHKNVHSSTIHNPAKLRPIQMSINIWTVIYSYSGILYSNENELIATCYNMEDAHQCDVEWKKLDTNEYILHDSIYIKLKTKKLWY